MRLYGVTPYFSQMTTVASHLVAELFLSHSLLYSLCQQVSTTVTSGSIAFLLLSLISSHICLGRQDASAQGGLFSCQHHYWF